MNKRSLLTVFFLLTLNQSCTQMMPHRDYLSEMDYDDSGYYRPNEDFPVMVGDTGKVGESKFERRRRTPASEFERQDRQGEKYLQAELRDLEGRQTEEQFELYDKYRAQLGSVSEKIYFLKLPVYERKEYLLSKGLIKTEPRTYFQSEQQLAQRNNSVSLGMSKSDVMSSIGEPQRIEVAGNPSYENERWVYGRNGASKYIYFESGRVEGWE